VIAAEPTQEMPARTGAVFASYLYAVIIAGAVGYFLFFVPIQFSDCYGNMLKLDTTWRDLMIAEFTQRSYLRPFLWAELKVVYDASGGNFFPWFRGTHVVQVLGLVLMYVMLVRPRTWRDAMLVPFGLAVLLGIHTFRGTIVEAFPVNTFLTILLCCFAAACLAFSTYRWWNDVIAVALFVVAALTVESGLLVAVIFIAAAVVGARGTSRVALATIVALLASYFVLRFTVLQVGAPGLIERSSGYGFRTLDPPELVARFRTNPIWFYAYNIVTSAVSVLFAEPRGGTFGMLHGIVLGAPYPPAILNFIASTAATSFIALYVIRRWREWFAWRFDHDDRLVFLFIAVLGANSVITYPYTKDVIMSPAGAFFAVAAFVAVKDAMSRLSSARYASSVAVLALGLVAGTTWAVRLAAVPVTLQAAAHNIRTEWAYAEDWLDRSNAEGRASQPPVLLKRLRDDAVYRSVLAPPLGRHWLMDVD
jgi:hypothetical protein